MNYFTVKVFRLKTTWSGKVKRIKVSETRHDSPESMLAEASKWDTNVYSVWTHEPEHWQDERPPRTDESIDYSKDDAADFPF